MGWDDSPTSFFCGVIPTRSQLERLGGRAHQALPPGTCHDVALDEPQTSRLGGLTLTIALGLGAFYTGGIRPSMLVSSRRQRYRAHNRTNDSEQMLGDDPGHDGWDTVQGYILDHDEATMNDFAEDIDTLLVLAGLFSAVLTAFVIESYHTLQEDDTQLSVQLLSTISAQLAGTANTTSPLPSGLAEPASSDVLVNCLWFLALVFSLVAALLGIFTKQWCREYLKWHSSIASAIENVTLRQMRYEAWHNSNITIIIAAVPVLLELALVLFLSGLVVFGWTLERHVAIVLTCAVGLSLTTVFVLLAHPLLDHRSPYKSPTGLAFLRLIHFSSFPFRLLGVFLGPSASAGYQGCLSDSAKTAVTMFTELTSQNWRARELGFLERPSGRVVSTIRTFLGRHISITGVVSDLFRADLLIAALAWVRRSSNTQQVQRAVLYGARTMRSPTSPDLYEPAESVAHYTSLYALARLCGDPSDCAIYERRMVATYPLREGSETGVIDDAGLHYGTYYSTIDTRLTLQNFTHERIFHSPVQPAIDRSALFLPILREALVKDLMVLGDVCERELRAGIAGPQSRHLKFQPEAAPRIVAVLSALILTVSDDGTQQDSTDFPDYCCKTLIALFHHLKPYERAYCHGVQSAIFRVLAGMAHVTISPNNLHIEAIPKTRFGDDAYSHTQLAVQLYGATRGYSWVEGRHLFITAAFDALRSDSWSAWPREAHSLTVMRRLLTCLVDAVCASLEESYGNLGSYIELEWFTPLRTMHFVLEVVGSLGDVPCVMLEETKADFVVLLGLLHECSARGLLWGSAAREDLRKAFGYLKFTPGPVASRRRVGVVTITSGKEVETTPSEHVASHSIEYTSV